MRSQAGQALNVALSVAVQRRRVGWIAAVLLGFWIASVLATATWISVRSAAIHEALESGDPLRTWHVGTAEDWIRGRARFVPQSPDLTEALLGGDGPDSLALNLRGRPIALGLSDVLKVDYRAQGDAVLTIIGREFGDGPLLRATPIKVTPGAQTLVIDLGDQTWTSSDDSSTQPARTQLSQLRLLWAAEQPVSVTGLSLSAPNPLTPRQRPIEARSLLYPLRSLELAKATWSSTEPVIPAVPGYRWLAGSPLLWMLASVLIAASAPIVWLRTLEPDRYRVPLWVLGVLCVLTITPDLTSPSLPVAVALVTLALGGMLLGWRRSPSPTFSLGSRDAWRASLVFVLLAGAIAAAFWYFHGADFSPKTIWRYFAWACLQQWLLSRVLLVRGNDARGANACAGALFGLLHWPSLPLMTLTSAAGWYWARLHQRGDALVPATVSHTIAGWLLLSSLPNWVGVSGEVGMRYFG